ncbi:RNA polymerase sigma factor [Kitasatospora purpeofusca]|uniref:RNA polymerase sigma factor n=1 Tax=Kitasatospora purpeofusca TaxID=67352 RepID=UPI00225AB95F|nr:sigma-70 family RNA polymerase sigma factor [Kitasatospora purpeofusca]MCX4758436.1 sigma-70 family RNA polymerase sigma factor [Kitasatospora purpeofusca]WSR31113.1 sigma-70 family RNA polymerase sigma factor [Kitasatospora purpeofusca]
MGGGGAGEVAGEVAGEGAGGDRRRDALLVVRCQLGEREAFGELVDVWHAPLWRYLRGVSGGSPHLADDLAQEAWVAVVRGLPGLRQPERFAPWLFTIARRALTNHLRQEYRAPETSGRARAAGTGTGAGADAVADAEVEAGVAVGADHLLDDVLTTMQVEAGLNDLPPQEREVLILFHLEDLPLAVCAEVLGVPTGTVKSRLHRARRMLRSALVEKGYGA